MEFNCLLLGPTGAGKSSLIRALMDRQPDRAPIGDGTDDARDDYDDDGKFLLPEVSGKDGSAARGTTKRIRRWTGKVLGNKQLILWDAPGFGDQDTRIGSLMAELEDLMRDAASEFRTIPPDPALAADLLSTRRDARLVDDRFSRSRRRREPRTI